MNLHFSQLIWSFSLLRVYSRSGLSQIASKLLHTLLRGRLVILLRLNDHVCVRRLLGLGHRVSIVTHLHFLSRLFNKFVPAISFKKQVARKKVVKVTFQVVGVCHDKVLGVTFAQKCGQITCGASSLTKTSRTVSHLHLGGSLRVIHAF